MPKTKPVQHTPGPWKIIDSDIVICSDGFTPTGVQSNAFDATKRNKANAHLIVAAPDLLDAAKKALLHEQSSLALGRLAREQDEIVNLLTAAIAKAQGTTTI